LVQDLLAKDVQVAKVLGPAEVVIQGLLDLLLLIQVLLAQQ
jgi:hypothetical protein